MGHLRLLHTADWHLGHTLRDHPRHQEHQAFLDWLVGALVAHEVDALLVAGDVFDTHNPSAQAQAQWYGFLAKAAQAKPGLQIVAIAGNHDSAERLAAPAPLLQGLGVRVVGALPRHPDGAMKAEDIVFPLQDAAGQVAAWVVAMPFLRPVDLPPGLDLVAGVEARHAEAFAHAEGLRQPHQALVAMGHAYLAHTQLSELSERKVLGGNQHALPASLFPESVAYAALGHLHLAQSVGREGIRYSGSPLPLSMAETDYRHQVLLVDLEGPQLKQVTALELPRAVAFWRLGPEPLPALLKRLEALPPRGDLAEHERPFLELTVALSAPEPRLREAILGALEGKAPRLVALRQQWEGPVAEGSAPPRVDLRELAPEAVFRLRHERLSGQGPSEQLLRRFHALLAEAQEAQG